MGFFKVIWQGKVMRIPYINMLCDAYYLRTKWLDNKTEDRVLIKNVSLEYIKIKC